MLEKYNGIWDKVNNTIKKEFCSEPVYNEKYVTNKIKSYEVEINTILSEDLIPKEGSQCNCLSIPINNIDWFSF